MSKPSVTYKALRDIIYNYIVANCANIDGNYNNMNSSFKAGFITGKTSFGTNGKAGYGAWYQQSIVSGTEIPQVASSTVSSQLDSFFSTQMGITNQNETIPATDFLNTFYNLVSFCIGRIYFAKSPWDTTGVIYYKSGTDYPATAARDSSTGDLLLVKANDVKGLISKVTTWLKNNSYRNGNCRYTIIFTNSP